MSDQYGNNVDKEVWVPARAKDWIDMVQVGSVKDGSQKPAGHEYSIPQRFVLGIDLAQSPLDTYQQWAIALADGTVGEVVFDSEGAARQELQYERAWLAKLAVPEEYHPVLMERTVETVAGSWKILNV